MCDNERRLVLSIYNGTPPIFFLSLASNALYSPRGESPWALNTENQTQFTENRTEFTETEKFDSLFGT